MIRTLVRNDPDPRSLSCAPGSARTIAAMTERVTPSLPSTRRPRSPSQRRALAASEAPGARIRARLGGRRDRPPHAGSSSPTWPSCSSAACSSACGSVTCWSAASSTAPPRSPPCTWSRSSSRRWTASQRRAPCRPTRCASSTRCWPRPRWATAIVSLRIWSPDGTVAYSPDPSLIGQTFPVEGGLAEALTGRVVAERSDLQSSENVLERGRFDHLLEMYVPVRLRGSDRIIAVAEFYQLPKRSTGRSRTPASRRGSWSASRVAASPSCCCTASCARRSQTIDRQQTALQAQVGELSSLLAQNAALHQRVSAAAERTTTLNERALRRIGADLHDGPAQMLSLALLRLDRVRARRRRRGDAQDLAVIQGASRTRCARCGRSPAACGCRSWGPAPRRRSPQRAIARPSPADRRQRSSGPGRDPRRRAQLPVKIALYRATPGVAVERHPPRCRAPSRSASAWKAALLRLDVSDEGPGFDLERVGGAGDLDGTGHLGLAGVREQAELLGGASRSAMMRRAGPS